MASRLSPIINAIVQKELAGLGPEMSRKGYFPSDMMFIVDGARVFRPSNAARISGSGIYTVTWEPVKGRNSSNLITRSDEETFACSIAVGAVPELEPRHAHIWRRPECIGDLLGIFEQVKIAVAVLPLRASSPPGQLWYTDDFGTLVRYCVSSPRATPSPERLATLCVTDRAMRKPLAEHPFPWEVDKSQKREIGEMISRALQPIRLPHTYHVIEDIMRSEVKFQVAGKEFGVQFRRRNMDSRGIVWRLKATEDVASDLSFYGRHRAQVLQTCREALTIHCDQLIRTHEEAEDILRRDFPTQILGLALNDEVYAPAPR